MAKRKTKKVARKIKKGLKRNRGFRIFFITLVVLLLVGAFACFYFNLIIIPGLLEFNLLGEDRIQLEIDSTYEEPGFTATYRNLDLKEYVDVEIKDYKEEILTEIDTKKAGTFKVNYTLKFKNYEKTLTRIVTVSLSSNIITYDEDLLIHFMELGNKFTGDSIYIKAGDTDILIDAGSRASSSTTISEYIDTYCTDGILEYVIVTHAHQDHIPGSSLVPTNPAI